MATLGTLRNVVARKMGMDNTASSTDQTLLDEWANQGVTDVLLRTHCTILCLDITLSSGSWKFNLPSAVLAIHRVTRSGATGRTVRVSPEEIIERRRTNSTSTPTTAATDLIYAVEAHNLMTVYPTPDADLELEVFYIPRPTNELANASENPSATAYGYVPSELHKGIEYYMLWQAGEYQEDPKSQAGQAYRAIYEDWIRRVARPAITHKGGSQLPRARSRRSHYPPVANDVYPRY